MGRHLNNTKFNMVSNSLESITRFYGYLNKVVSITVPYRKDYSKYITDARFCNSFVVSFGIPHLSIDRGLLIPLSTDKVLEVDLEIQIEIGKHIGFYKDKPIYESITIKGTAFRYDGLCVPGCHYEEAYIIDGVAYVAE
jgi:hypothetical protein